MAKAWTSDPSNRGLALYGPSEEALELLAPNPDRGSVICTRPDVTIPIEHAITAWIDTVGDSDAACRRSLSDPGCQPGMDDPVASTVLDLAPGYTIVQLKLLDP